jgi:hypothetical protein
MGNYNQTVCTKQEVDERLSSIQERLFLIQDRFNSLQEQLRIVEIENQTLHAKLDVMELKYDKKFDLPKVQPIPEVNVDTEISEENSEELDTEIIEEKSDEL